MARYRIHRIHEAPREQFRWTAHTGGLAVVKPKDYEPGLDVEAATPYAAWSEMLSEGTPLAPGDVLEALREDGMPGDLQIVKYIGFEPAKWFVPEPKPEQKIIFEDMSQPASVARESSALG